MKVHHLRWLPLACFFLFPQSPAQITFSTANFQGILAAESQVLQSLTPTALTSLDFSPSDVFSSRNGNGNYHTGDLTFRYRVGSTMKWTDGNTASSRVPVADMSGAGALAAADLNSTLSNSNDALNVTRTWIDYNGDLALQFTVTNIVNDSVEIGSLGFPVEFNNIFTNRTAVETRDKCVLLDPYIGLHAGYVQVTRLTGTGPDLVITPLTDATKFEAWRFLPEAEGSLDYASETFEGIYEWQVYTKAWAENEWNATEPWNKPTSAVLKPGEHVTVGLRFSVAPTNPAIEETVMAAGVPVAVGIPGYVLPVDVVGKLYLHTNDTVSSLTSSPDGAFAISTPRRVGGSIEHSLQPSNGTWGRVRLSIQYTNGKTQTVHYYVTKSAPEAVRQLGNFHTTNQLFTDESDPFGRAHSIMTYDRSANAIVTQEDRAWIAGISDEGGAGSFLTAAMKQSAQPLAAEISTLETFVAKVVWGTLQVSQQEAQYSVRKSVFFYDRALVSNYTYSPAYNWTRWSAWNKEEAYAVDRSYDYVHVTGLYWSLYRAGRAYPNVLTLQTAEYYLLQAYRTVMYMMSTDSNGTHVTSYWDFGLMGETVVGEVLDDLYTENYTAEAAALEAAMKTRVELWATQDDPYGSEMPWDSTGQEGVYYWAKYFGYDALANKTIDSIVGYMPTVAHWGWNGNARRYWDFLYAGKLKRIERQLHHYGSGLNSLPLLAQFRSDPSDSNFHLLRVGYGGNQGPLTNIDSDGFAAAAFHSWPNTLAWDSYSGDYGPNFLGHVLGAATYLVAHPVYGWTSFGGNIVQDDGQNVTVEPRDAVRHRVFVAPLGLYIAIDAGVIDSFTYTPSTGGVTVGVTRNIQDDAKGESASSALVTFRQTAAIESVGLINVTSTGLERRKGGWVLPLGDDAVHNIDLMPA